MKCIEIDYHYIRDKDMFRVICYLHVTSSHQIVDVSTNSLIEISYNATCTKLDIFYFYAPARGGVFDSCIELSAHLGPLIFTSYVRTFVLFFPYTILGFFALTVNTSNDSHQYETFPSFFGFV